MKYSCESLQDLCRRVIVQSTGSKRSVRHLPLPHGVIDWLKEYEEDSRFDRKCSSLKHVEFSADDQTITFKGTSFYSTTLIVTPYGHGYKRGKHEWVFYFDNCCGQVAVCVVPLKFKQKRKFGISPYVERGVGWCFNQVGKATFEVPLWEEKEHYAGLFNSWDMIGVLLDMEEGTLGFMVNGTELGVAFDEGLIGQELFPAVSLCGAGEKATFVSSRTYI